MSVRTFRYFTEDAHFWSLSDYACVVDVMQRLGAKRVLEFGPGSSTLALIEGGADWIDSCEDDPGWFATYIERLEDRFLSKVCIRPYRFSTPLSVPVVDAARYDLALVDGPHATPLRPIAIEYCLARCDRVLVPQEDWNHGCRNPDALLPPVIRLLAARANRPLEVIETGPLSGSFALIGPLC